MSPVRDGPQMAHECLHCDALKLKQVNGRQTNDKQQEAGSMTNSWPKNNATRGCGQKTIQHEDVQASDARNSLGLTSDSGLTTMKRHAAAAPDPGILSYADFHSGLL